MQKLFIGALIGVVVGIGCGILGTNIFKPGLYKQLYLEVNGVIIPNVCMALDEKKPKVVETTASNLKVSYDLNELSSEEVNKYVDYLKKDGFMLKCKDDASGITALCKEEKEGKVANVEIFVSEKGVSIDYNMFEGNVVIEKDRNSYLIDKSLKYYDFESKKGRVLVPSIENVISLELDREWKSEYFIDYTYKFDESLSGEQREKYKDRYVELLKKNGYVKKDVTYSEVYENGCSEVAIDADRNLKIQISHVQ